VCAFSKAAALKVRPEARTALTPHVHIPDAAAVFEAEELITHFGEFAADEAAARASRSRNLGNVVHYCRWRQIQRLIEVLGAVGDDATVH